MSGKKIVTVFGATGNQGGSIVNFWASTPELKEKYTVRAITRDTSKPSAQELKSKGAEVVAADLDNSDSLKHAVEGAHAVFAVTNYWEYMSKDKEVAQGKAIADAVFAAGVKHFIFSSLPHTTKLTEGKLSQIDHFVGKAEIEEYVEEHKSKSGTWGTYYMPGFFMSNFQGMGFINKGEDGVPTFAAPHGGSSYYGLVDIQAETGNYVWGAIEAGQAADGKEIQAVGDWVTADECVSTLSKEGGAGEVRFYQIPRDTFRGFLQPKMGDYVAEEMTQNMELIGEYSYYGKGAEKNQAESDKFLYNKKKVSWAEYVKAHAPYKF